MATQFPTALDDFTNPSGTDALGSSAVLHSTQHSNLNDAVEALERKVGIDSSADVDSIDYKLAAFEALGFGETGWKDLVAAVGASPVGVVAPTLTNFGSAATPQRQEYAFTVNDYVFIQPFHVNHDIKVGGKAYLHIHWSTNGTNVQPVKWEFSIRRAKRTNQEAFPAPTVWTVQEAPPGYAWAHMVTETVDPNYLTLTEPDELILVTLRRVTNGATENTDTVYALNVDFHYESNRDHTPLRAPPFYS